MILKKVYAAHGSDGKTYEIHVYAEPTATAGSAKHMPMDVLSTICTSSGQTLRVLAKGRYQIADTDIVLESVDPEAI
ncbi:MAG TPA: hypothetical protein VFG55_04795 [Rhodanobacteraceae bacterium]|nr:hypothetical protein [Rhodanobacteraceae bacterium]